MDDRLWARRFDQELKFVIGEIQSYFHRDYPSELKSALEAAKLCLKTNFAAESHLRTRLLNTLLTKFHQKNHLPAGAGSGITDTFKEFAENEDYTELDLDSVVGGVSDASVGGCVLCGCDVPSDSIHSEKCSACGHDRTLHP